MQRELDTEPSDTADAEQSQGGIPQDRRIAAGSRGTRQVEVVVKAVSEPVFTPRWGTQRATTQPDMEQGGQGPQWGPQPSRPPCSTAGCGSGIPPRGAGSGQGGLGAAAEVVVALGVATAEGSSGGMPGWHGGKEEGVLRSWDGAAGLPRGEVQEDCRWPEGRGGGLPRAGESSSCNTHFPLCEVCSKVLHIHAMGVNITSIPPHVFD